MKHILKISAVFFAAVAALLCASCGSYSLAGTPQELPFSSIYVKPVQNKAYAAQAGYLLSNDISSCLQNTPNLRLTSEDDAQAVLEVEIVDYARKGFATSESDTALAQSFAIEMTASCSLRDTRTGKYIFKNKKVKYVDNVYVGADNNFIGPEYQNMTVLSRGLARRIADEVIGIW